jgi:hypothetical protein
MRRFYFNRKQDVSGVSGTGRVCEGIQFSDGRCAVRWLTKTASTELWDSVEEAIQVHGHSGATELVWEDGELMKKSRDALFGTVVEQITLSARDAEQFVEALNNPPEPTEHLKRAMAEYSQKYERNKEVTELVEVLSKAAPLYISGDADNLGNEVARIEAMDDEAGIREIGERINSGQELFKQWIERMGGEVIEQGGDEFLGKIADLDAKKLEAFRSAYAKLVGTTLTLGVGRKISEATRARFYGKLTGKDRLVYWNESVDAGLKEKLAITTQDETTKILNSGVIQLEKAGEGPGSRGGQVVGTTASGKPIYAHANHAEHKEFTAVEHYHAMKAHAKAAKKFPRHSAERLHHLKQQVLHTYKMSHLDGSDPHFYIPNHAYKKLKMNKPAEIENHGYGKDPARKSEEVTELLEVLEKAKA